ncbi:MAG: site-specific integrase [Alphaproteobacteria bacterium]|nr:site-specific integrase [Alphaproteobacteria bacterium]
MPNITKRTSKSGKVSYRVLVRVKNFPTQSATLSSLTKAKTWASKVENEIRDGKYLSQIKAKEHTVAEMIDRYIENVLPNKPKVQYDWTFYLNEIKGLIGMYTLHEATLSVLVEMRDKIAKVKTRKGTLRSGSTVNKFLTALSSAYGYAVNEWEWLEVNPMLRVKKMKEAPPRIRFLDDNERKSLLDACKKAKNPYLYPAVVVALSTGARKMEILSLKWDDLDLGNNRAILYNTKNGEVRSIPIVYKSEEVMRELYENRTSDKWIFPSQDDSKPFDITRSWRKAIKESGITNFRFHDLRHTAASYLLNNGVTLGQLAEILGHKTLQMVKRYAHLCDQKRKLEVENMNKKIFRGD